MNIKQAVLGTVLISGLFLGGNTAAVAADFTSATEATTEATITFDEVEEGGTIIDPTDPGSIIPGPGNPNNGSLRVNYISNFNFGETIVSGADKVYFAELDTITDEEGTERKVPNFVSVEDNRGTNQGWQLKVTQNSQLATENLEELEGAELSFQDLNQMRDVTYQPNLASDQVLRIGNAVNIADASEGNGAGSWTIAFGDSETAGKAIKLDVPGESKKIKGVEYKTTLTWDLGDAPL